MIFLAKEPTFYAKGWLFRYLGARRSVAFVGSSNVSAFALRNGIESNTRTTIDQVITDCQSNFDDYWDELSQAFMGNLYYYDPNSGDDFETWLTLFTRHSLESCGNIDCSTCLKFCEAKNRDAYALQKAATNKPGLLSIASIPGSSTSNLWTIAPSSFWWRQCVEIFKSSVDQRNTHQPTVLVQGYSWCWTPCPVSKC